MPPSLSIRRATAADADVIAALASELYALLKDLGYRVPFSFTAERYLRDGFGETPAFVGLVAERQGAVIGYAILHPSYDTDRGRREAYLDDLFVQENCRNLGIGRDLLRAAAELARSHYGAEGLWWGVQEHNAGALRFYESAGAKYVKDVKFMCVDIQTLLTRDG